MNFYLLFLVSYIPGLFWVWFFYRKDRLEKEPKLLVLKVFLFGVLAVFPAGLIESLFSHTLFSPETGLFELFLSSVFITGLVEEFAKYGAVRLTVYDNEEFNEVMDGIIYMVSAALGFAATENLFYTLAFGVQVGIIRAFITPLAHACFSGIMGYYIGRAKFSSKKYEIIFTVKGLLFAVLLHGLYNFFLLGELLSPFAVGLMVLLIYLYLLGKIGRAEKFSPF